MKPLLPICRRLAPFLIALRQNNPHAPKEFTAAIEELVAALSHHDRPIPQTPHLRVLPNEGDET